MNTAPSNLYERAKTGYSTDWERDASELLVEKFSKHLRPNENIRLEGFYGADCVLLRAFVGTAEKAQVFEFFIDAVAPSKRDDAFGLLIDFFDGVIEEFFMRERNAGLPLDFAKRQFEKTLLFARQEFHNFEAERLADKLLKT